MTTGSSSTIHIFIIICLLNETNYRISSVANATQQQPRITRERVRVGESMWMRQRRQA